MPSKKSPSPYAKLLKAAKAAEASMKKIVKKKSPVENGYKKLLAAAKSAEANMKKLIAGPAKKRAARAIAAFSPSGTPARSTRTKYLNSKKRQIYQGPRGGYFSVAAGGRKVYGIYARYRQDGNKVVKIKVKKGVTKTAV